MLFDVLKGLFGSKTFLSTVLGIVFECINAQYGLGAPSGSGLLPGAAMSLRTLGKEKSQ